MVECESLAVGELFFEVNEAEGTGPPPSPNPSPQCSEPTYGTGSGQCSEAVLLVTPCFQGIANLGSTLPDVGASC